MHGRYGHLDLSQNGKRGIAHQISKIQNPKSKILYELPISNLSLANRILPWGGGGYFRLTPLQLFTAGVNAILDKSNGYVFYIHPWEIDPDQPRVNDASASYKLRHYSNLKSTQKKLSKFIRKFQHHRFINCSRYINEKLISYDIPKKMLPETEDSIRSARKMLH